MKTINNEVIISLDREEQEAIVLRNGKYVLINLDGREKEIDPIELEITCENDELYIASGATKVKLAEYEAENCI